MPRIRRERIPEALMAHLVRRIRQREISTAQLGLFARWLDVVRKFRRANGSNAFLR